MRHIRLTDGTEYDVDLCGARGDMLMINVTSDASLLSLVATFSDPAKVERIEHWFDDTETDHIVYNGYTTLSAVALSATGKLLTLRS